MIHLCDKMPDACADIGYILIIIEMNFFLFESSDEPFSIPVSPTDTLYALRKSQCRAVLALRYRHLKGLNPLIAMTDLGDTLA